ncbi:Txe/YoeB family addiction module toxin [Microcoleus sp. C2C3]|uniref:Txe/YoeB family addiction module toxin n=1 Tax=unclassified Microcoleus TaxID=2642155 RepID=UPI002FD046E5
MSKKRKQPPQETAEPEKTPVRDAVFNPKFLEDLTYWVDVDRKVALRLLKLVEAIVRDPFTGIGKPEPLKYLDAGTWSRRLTQEHRIVYLVSDNRIDFLQARYHYED